MNGDLVERIIAVRDGLANPDSREVLAAAANAITHLHVKLAELEDRLGTEVRNLKLTIDAQRQLLEAREIELAEQRNGDD